MKMTSRSRSNRLKPRSRPTTKRIRRITKLRPEKRVIRYFTIDEKDTENKVAVNASDWNVTTARSRSSIAFRSGPSTPIS